MHEEVYDGKKVVFFESFLWRQFITAESEILVNGNGLEKSDKQRFYLEPEVQEEVQPVGEKAVQEFASLKSNLNTYISTAPISGELLASSSTRTLSSNLYYIYIEYLLFEINYLLPFLFS